MNSIRTSFTTISLLGLLIFSSIAYIAKAQEPVAADLTPQERFTAVQEERASAGTTQVASVADRVEGIRASLTTRQQERFINLASNVANRMEAAITRLKTISQKLEARVSTITADGVDTTEAGALIQQANQSLAAAEARLETIDEEIADFATSEQPRDNYGSLRETYRVTADDLRAARAALITAVRSVRTNTIPETTNDVEEMTTNDNE